jgi:hypothetical protein
MKIRVVRFCTLPLVATSQKNTCFDPSDHLKNGKGIFYVETEKTLVTKVCWECKDAHLHQKWDHGSIVCWGTCTNHGHLARKTKKTPAWKHLFVKEFTCEPLACHVWYFS